MQELTIYQIKDKLYIRYIPEKEPTTLPTDVIFYRKNLYKEIKLEDIKQLLDKQKDTIIEEDLPW